MKNLTPIFIIFISFCSHAEQSFRGWGLGQAECSVFKRHAENDDTGKNKLIYIQWFNGYITGINAERKGVDDISGGMDRDVMYSEVLNYCKSYPNSYVWRGLNVALKGYSNGG